MKSLNLFETPSFLEQKLDAHLFEEIPQQPGIYRFYDKQGTLLYVGKAKNLRRRLFTYKRAKPGQTSRKEASLISKIHRFEYDVLGSEEEAILMENHWIREHRPEFNHANKHTETYYFITIQENDAGLMFGLSMNPSGNLFPEKERPLYTVLNSSFSKFSNRNVYGCFKGHRTVRTSLGALLQLLWMAEYRSVSPHFLPVQLNRNLTPIRFYFSISSQSILNTEQLMTMLDHWFLGTSPDLVHYLNEVVTESKQSLFTEKFIDENMQILLGYFQRDLERHQIIRESVPNRQSHLIHQHELDDLIVKFKDRL